MAWFILQRVVELLLCIPLWDAFGSCTDFVSAAKAFHELTLLAQIGAITVVLIVSASILATLRQLAIWTKEAISKLM